MKKAEASSLKSKSGSLLTIALVVFIDLLGFGIVIPILPYYAKQFGSSAWTLGLLMASYSFFQFLCAPLWGRLSDHIGRKPVLMASIFGGALSLLLMGFAHSITWLFVGRIFAGLCAANISTAYAYVADITDEKDRTKGMGIIGAGFGMGFIFGPAIGGWLSKYGYPTPFFFGAALSALNLILAAWILKEPKMAAIERSANRSKRFDWGATAKVLSNPKRQLGVSLFFLLTFAVTQMEVSFAYYMNRYFGYSAHEAGMLLAVMGIIMILIQGGLIGRLSKKFGENALIMTGFFLCSGALAIFASTHSLQLNIAMLMMLSVGHGILHPSLSSFTSKASSAADHGATMGVFQSAGSLARVVGPPCAGWLFDRVNPSAPFMFGAMVLALGLSKTLFTAALKK